MRLTSTTGFRAAICAAAAALLVVLATPTPAFANNIMVAGSAANVGKDPGTSTVTVKNYDVTKADGVRVAVSVTGEAASFVDVEIGGGCKGSGGVADCGKINRMGEKSFTVTVRMKADAALKQGESKTGNIEFRVEAPHAGTATPAPLTVTGFTQVATGISGLITDVKDDEAIEGAKVAVKDGEGTKYGPATTGPDGKFNITDAQIQPDATLTYTITKKGYEKKSDNYDVAPNTPINIEVRLEKKASEKSEPAPDQDQNDSGKGEDESGFTFTTWILIILGVLLAIGGVIAIWMLLRKGKEDEEDEEKLPDEPVTHRMSASQTGKFGVYEGSGMRPGADNPTMIHSGGLINDGDLARYGSEPPSAAGFGPAYNDPTQAVRSPGDVPPAATTQRYAANEPVSGGWQSNEPVSGSTQRYPAAEPASGSWRSNEPTSGAWQSNQPVSGADSRYPAEPASGGSWRSNEPVSGADQRYPAAEPASGSWRSNEPTSGAWQSNQPTSGAWQSNQPVSGADSRYPAEPASGSWRSNESVSGSTQRYPAAESGSGGGGYPSENSYGDRGAQYNDRGDGGRHYREPESHSGYGDQQPQQSSGRRYRDDDYGDYDDRPRSW